MRNSITRTGRAAAPVLRLFAFSGLTLEDGETMRHYVGYKVGHDIDEAYRDAMAECYRHFPQAHGYTCHSVEIVEVPGVQILPPAVRVRL